ncbi:MAG: hypothetical protein LBJ96_00885 [Holosporaceae bacterium]|jgi:hypothetical protein|nr:hypothetical protein [Holosporaceae bacterium]
MLKSFCLVGAFLGFWAAGGMIPSPDAIPEGVCPERVPFYNYEGTFVWGYSFCSKINIPIHNGSEVVTKEEWHRDASDRIYGMVQSLEIHQLNNETISLGNKLIICDAIISSAQNMLNTFDYWAARGFNKLDECGRRRMEGMTKVKAFMVKTRAELVASDSGCVKHKEVRFLGVKMGDTIDYRIPDGVYPDDWPRLGRLHHGVLRDTLPESVFFKLVTSAEPEGRKVNFVEGVEILRGTLTELLHNLNNPSISRDEKLALWQPVLTSLKYAINTINYWRSEDFSPCVGGFFWGTSRVLEARYFGETFSAYRSLSIFVPEIYDELSKSKSGCIPNRELPHFDLRVGESDRPRGYVDE